MKKIYTIIFVLLVIDFFSPQTTNAIPAFARKYGFNCAMCHAGFAKLNDYGQRFRDNGYQIPGQEGNEKNVFDTPPPISLRTSLGNNTDINSNHVANSFNLNGLDLLAAGVLHKNISFLMIYTPRIDEPYSSYSGGADNFLQPGALESVSLVFSNIIKDALNLRIGRFEPAYHMFSSKRSYYLYEPYEIYGITTPKNNFVFDDNQVGIEASGHFKCGFKYTAGIVNGTGAYPDNNNGKDIYLNLTQTIGKGEGQTAGQRIGIFGYYGWQPLKMPGSVIGSAGQTNGKSNEPFSRIGATASLNWENFNLQMMYMYGSDNKSLNSLDSTTNYNYTGGLVELDYIVLVNNRLVASALYNWIKPPSYDSAKEVNAYSALLRYYLGNWSAVNIALHAEYTHRIAGKTNKTTNDLVSLGLDFAF